ncbi:ankyrin repeat domain-containing protein 27 [Aplysia californica]|uniref:Ankyrin repeat domain-containing protein 27 n=1 Tax=Aplysia californica TaxID=6500 RepID=A0ABM0JSZ1_APLCA|nr:ankyrin repeat domain-containing protein 27 [Aplysia californica]
MAASSKYDEDLYENPYFIGIMSKFPAYIDKIVSSKGILCVPKYSIAAQIDLQVTDLEDHILLPTKEVVDDADDFITISGKTVRIGDGSLIGQAGFDSQREASILFAETFHTDEGGSYRVFCIGGFLNRTVDVSPRNSSVNKVLSPTSYQQCMDLLWSHSGGQKSRDSLNRMLSTFATSYDRLEGENLRSIVDAANTHFTKAMQLMLKDSVVRRSARHNVQYMENLKVAVETYVMNAIHKHLFRVITATFATQDAEINKITRNLVSLQLTDLGIRKVFNQNIPPAKKELSRLNRYSTPMGRLFCVKRVVAALTKPPKQNGKEDSKDTAEMMTTDDLLPILIFLIIKSETPNWMANLVYMRHFHFAKSSDDDEFGFYLASIEAALEHIRSGNVRDEIKPLKRERWNSIVVTDVADSSASSSNTVSSATGTPSRQVSQTSVIDEFFKYVESGDEKMVQQMLEKPHRSSEELHLKLCHPLCACDKCDKLMGKLRNDSELVTAYTRDNRGYTALHMAAYYGQGLLIDLLIQNNAVVDATDYLGQTPLHLACQRGYQNVMLLLLHFGADVMARDNEGNSPLHLCCANGHEDCVKALVFYDASLRKMQINTANEFGDTPLHLAAKWGYESIVKALLENGADATLCNRKRQTPVSLAQNVKVQRWLQMAADGQDLQPIRPMYVSPKTRSRSSSSSSTSTFSHHQSSLNIYEPENSASIFRVETASLEAANESEKRRKKEKLFKAIIEGDIQLVKFYLGVQSKVADPDDDDETDVVLPGSSSISDMCHPLCQCGKCRGIVKVTQRSKDKLSVNAKTSTGYSPIHMAVLHSHSDIVALLIALRADLSAHNHKSLTPLHLSCCMKNSLITDMLLRGGAKLDAQDMNGDTPLLIASSNGFINGVKMLIQNKARLNVTNGRGNSAVHEAVKRNQLEVVKLLLEAGAEPRISNKHEQLPVHLTQDPAMQALLMATTFKLNEAEAKAQRQRPVITQDRNENRVCQITIKELFAAFEESDLRTLKALNESVRRFDRTSSLRRAETKDKSSPHLKDIAQAYSIKSFNRGTLRKVQSLDKADPLYIYSLSQSRSMDSQLSSRILNDSLEKCETQDDSLLRVEGGDGSINPQTPTGFRVLPENATTPSGFYSSFEGSMYDEQLTPLGDNLHLSRFEEDFLSSDSGSEQGIAEAPNPNQEPKGTEEQMSDICLSDPSEVEVSPPQAEGDLPSLASAMATAQLSGS